MKKLRELYETHDGKVSDKWDIYLEEYDRVFYEYREKPINLLEIGIQNGGSLEIWSKYFPNAQNLIGCDINEDCKKLSYESEIIKVIIGDSNTDSAERRILKECNNFDIIIDDGSHTSSDIVRTFARYFPYLNYGGIFVIEDLHCSYWDSFEGGLYDFHSSLNFFKQLVDVINYEHWGLDRSIKDVLRVFYARHGISLSEDLLKEIHSVEFINSVCVVRKNERNKNELGVRNIAGTDEFVVAGHVAYEGKKNEALIQDDSDEKAQHPYFQIKSLKIKNEELTKQAKCLEERIGELENHQLVMQEKLSDVLSSRSWQYTQLLRQMHSGVKSLERVYRKNNEIKNLSGGWVPTLKKMVKTFRQGGVRALKEKIALSSVSPNSHPKDVLISYEDWVKKNDYNIGADEYKLDIDSLNHKPLISLLMPVYKPDLSWLDQAIESVRDQVYENWELCIADDASYDDRVRKYLTEKQQQDNRIKVLFREVNGHIAEASNSALTLANGEWVALLDQDDLIEKTALYEVVKALNSNLDANIIYSDEDKLVEGERREAPFFKPDWSPHLILSQAYLGHFCALRRSVVEDVLGFRTECNGSQDHDLWLRVALESTSNQIIHIPKALYHWRMHKESTSEDSESKPYAWYAGIRAVQNYFDGKYPLNSASVVKGSYPFTFKLEFNFPRQPKVSIIIPTRDRIDLLKTCVGGLLERTNWSNIEVIIIDNGSVEAESHGYFEFISSHDSRVVVYREDIDFNWSKLNNIGAEIATGDYLLFLNNDTDVKNPDWLDYLIGYASLPDVGIVGSLLLFEDGTIQHSGVVVGMGGWADHVYRTCPPDHYMQTPYLSPVITRNVLAVTGACMAISSKRFYELGKFDESFIICGSDVELGIRAHKAGYFNVQCAESVLYHYESKSRSPYVPENDFTQSSIKYEPFRTQSVDPFYNQNLSISSTVPILRLDKQC